MLLKSTLVKSLNVFAVVRPSGSCSESLMLLCNTILHVSELASFFFFFSNKLLHSCICMCRSQRSLPGSSDLVKLRKETHFI